MFFGSFFVSENFGVVFLFKNLYLSFQRICVFLYTFSLISTLSFLTNIKLRFVVLNIFLCSPLLMIPYLTNIFQMG